MGCNCKTKKTKKGDTTSVGSNDENYREKSFGDKIMKLGRLIFLCVIITLAFPFIYLFIMATTIKGQYGEPLDIVSIVKHILNKKESEEESEEDINPEDYELVGVDKVK